MAAGDEFAVVIFLVLGLVPAVSGTRLGCCDFPIACPFLAPVLCTVHCALRLCRGLWQKWTFQFPRPSILPHQDRSHQVQSKPRLRRPRRRDNLP